VGKMAVRRKVSLKLCAKVGGEIKCKEGGLKMTFEKGTVGPIEMELKYPEAE